MRLQVDFPARHIAAQLYRAQLRHMIAHRSYTTEVEALLQVRGSHHMDCPSKRWP